MPDLPSTPPRTSREQGQLALILLVALLPVMALVVAFSSRTVMTQREVRQQVEISRTTRSVLSAMEICKVVLTEADYSTAAHPGQNAAVRDLLDRSDTAILRPMPGGQCLYFDRATGERVVGSLSEAASPPGDLVPYRLLDQRTVDEVDVSIYLVPMVAQWFLLEAEGTHQSGVTRTARMLFRERDPFTRYSILVDKDAQPVSVRASGDIHGNERLRMIHGGWDLPGFVSSAQGFVWETGANWSNVGFRRGYRETATPITLPGVAEVAARIRPSVANPAAAEVAGDYVYIGSDYLGTSITFDDDTLVVTADRTDPSSGSVVTSTLYSGPVSTVQRIYAVGPITGLSGDLEGRLSVVTESTAGIRVTGSVRYVDHAGRSATTVGPAVAEYGANPEYTGNACLGLLAPAGSVIYDHSVPAVFELHAALFAGGRIGIPGLVMSGPNAPAPYNDPTLYLPGAIALSWDPTFDKQHVYTFGMSVSRNAKLRSTFDSMSGTKSSGFDDGAYIYDRALLRSPPPYFLDMPRPQFKAIEILEASNHG